MNKFKVVAPFEPSGDQGDAIEKLSQGVFDKAPYQTLKGVTGSGKTYTMAKIIEKAQQPTLIISHNKTLSAQLYREFKDFFPENAVEYFVSYYDYYQPEAYVPSKDLYIEKDADINQEIERLRLSATTSLLERKDVIIVATVSSIYGLGNPSSYKDMRLVIEKGSTISIDAVIKTLVKLLYERNNTVLERGNFRVRGDVLEIYPAYMQEAFRIELEWDQVVKIRKFDPLTAEILGDIDVCMVYPAKHFILDDKSKYQAIENIREEMAHQVEFFTDTGKLVEAQRIKTRTEYDMDMLEEIGYCSGIENYSRQLAFRREGERPEVLLDYYPGEFLTFIDESHVTLGQLRAMYEGDRSRKLNLVNFGFRLPSALDNRPLTYDEFMGVAGQIIYVSATPGEKELTLSTQVAEQLIRPTGLLDPEIAVRPTSGQIEDLYGELKACTERGERVLITTLTKKMAEDLTDYLVGLGLRVRYLHSEIETIERVELIRDLRQGAYDILVGINLLREGLDIPEVSLIAIMDADKVGFLRSTTSLIQTIGRAARNVNGRVIMYADTVTDSMRQALDETARRREIQTKYNEAHGITPTGIIKAVQDILIRKQDEKREGERQSIEVMKKGVNLLIPAQKKKLIRALEREMLEKAKSMEFEEAAVLRDEIAQLKESQD